MKIPSVVGLLVLALSLSLAGHAWAWGNEGHQAIGKVATTLLDPKADESVKAILGDDDLSAISTWLDNARAALKHHSGPLKNDPEALAFNTAFPTSMEWHYVNLPIGASEYSETSPFASKEDVVHAIGRAIAVLEGNSAEFSQKTALRILVHLVGDIHQPLHTACGYFDVSDPLHPILITDPAKALGKPNDRGGNQLFYAKSLELHAMWDGKLVVRIASSNDPTVLAAKLQPHAKIDSWPTEGDYHQWATAWAGNSVEMAGDAYEGILFGLATLDANKAISRIEITLPGGTKGYTDQKVLLAESQLLKASVHLAQLLNAIHFAPPMPTPEPSPTATPTASPTGTPEVAPAATPAAETSPTPEDKKDTGMDAEER